MPKDRAESAHRFRIEAADVAHNRPHPTHQANADEARYGSACYPMSFTKGLEHDEDTGLVADPADFLAFRACVDNGFVEPFTTRVPVPGGKPRRMWEAPTAGLVFELQGPDPQAVTMPPAPELCSDELTYEMAEVYELAILRDTPFTEFEGASSTLDPSIGRLNALDYAQNNFAEPDGTVGRERLGGPMLTPQTAFRGSGPGADKGPYLSQFMLIGTMDRDTEVGPQDGLIRYGAQTINQRVSETKHGDDYMTTWGTWLHVQNGFNPNDDGNKCTPNSRGQVFTKNTRFICTPRDLATYVHFDALYQAYLNACLLLLAQGTPFDPAFDLLSGPGGGGIMTDASNPNNKVDYNAGGFALYGGPHILSLVTEVATRGLKAVRYQKFNVHLRLRPEALAGRLARATEIEKRYPQICGCLTKMCTDLGGILTEIKKRNGKNDPVLTTENYLLPMAFAEGSPMHPTYGAGHATVAGACVTMLKAFFDTSAIFVRVTEKDGTVRAGFYSKAKIIEDVCCDFKVEAGAYRPVATKNEKHEVTACKLEFDSYGTFEKIVTKAKGDAPEKCHAVYPDDCRCPLTLEGELNKLAANISIGRNMAGVHYYSDYFDSVRMGEDIAIGILEEQALGYQTDPFVMSIPTFDGQTRRVGKR
ncbi:hypothetical protein [Gymnodinialimonas ulvae]|uniref:hypothetical protein n=1 Tax=Gymnodinialimonas ulvae TaxID=3126504 RepID=UPI0030A5B38F